MPHHRDSRANAEHHAPHHHHQQHHQQQQQAAPANLQETMENHEPNVTRCCAPVACATPDRPIRLDELLGDVVRVSCNNEHCPEGGFMHRACFEAWEQSVLTYLRSTGRARSWSEKQRLQNLWTKKGYDLAFKACGCRCAKGHLRKDLDWDALRARAAAATDAAEQAKKKKGRKKRGSGGNGNAPQQQQQQQQQQGGSPPACGGRPVLRVRTNSLSSTGSSPPTTSSSSAESPHSPTHGGGAGGGGSRRTPKSKFEFFSDRGCGVGAASIFGRRADYNTFNTLPRHKINSYHIKMDDDGSHGNDDTRCFILSNLAASRMTKTACVVCHATMHVFDRYPLVDGTFFLSPRQHSSSCVPVKVDGGQQFLCAVCMGCLEGWAVALRCRFCTGRWEGHSLILGTMYSYDVFAATPCCADRLRCNHCHGDLLARAADQPQQQQQQQPPHKLLPFFSDYSHSVRCPHCNAVDFHFVKPLSTYAQCRD